MSGKVEEVGQNIIEKLKNGDSFIMFYASWCPHCKFYLQEGILEKIKEKFPDLNVLKFEASSIPQHSTIASNLIIDSNGKNIEIESFPTFSLIKKNGDAVIFPLNEPRTFENQSRLIEKFLKNDNLFNLRKNSFNS